MTTTIIVPVKMRDQLGRLAAAEAERTGRKAVAYHEIIQKLLDEQERT